MNEGWAAGGIEIEETGAAGKEMSEVAVENEVGKEEGMVWKKREAGTSKREKGVARLPLC